MTSATAAEPPMPRNRLRRLAADPLLRSAYSLMLNVVLTAGSGVLFWILAARLFPSETVGRDSALVSAMTVFYVICSLGLSSWIIRFLPVVHMRPGRVVAGAYAITVSLSLVGGVAFVVIAPEISDEYRFLADSSLLAVTYVASIALWGVFALQDAVLTALRRAPWVPIENGVFGVLKLAALPVMLALGTSDAVFIAWVVPMAMMIIPINFLIFGRVLRHQHGAGGEHDSPIQRFGRAGLIRYQAQDWGAGVLFQLGSTALPTVLVGLVGSHEAAYFYMPFTIVAAFDLMFLNVASSLTVEAVREEWRTPELTRTVIRRFGPLLAAGVLVLGIGAPLVLAPFGAEYAEHGATVLRLLAVASVFRGLVALYTALCRINGTTMPVLEIQAVTFALVMSLTVVLGKAHGLDGVAVAWLVGNGAVALFTIPRILRTIRPDDGVPSWLHTHNRAKT